MSRQVAQSSLSVQTLPGSGERICISTPSICLLEDGFGSDLLAKSFKKDRKKCRHTSVLSMMSLCRDGSAHTLLPKHHCHSHTSDNWKDSSRCPGPGCPLAHPDSPHSSISAYLLEPPSLQKGPETTSIQWDRQTDRQVLKPSQELNNPRKQEHDSRDRKSNCGSQDPIVCPPVGILQGQVWVRRPHPAAWPLP